MKFNEYQNLAKLTQKQFATKDEMVANVGLGLCGESGEVADILKKHLLKSKELDVEHLKEELGDVLWYLAEACECFDFTLEDIAKANIEKLKKRHPQGFDGYGKREHS